MYEEILFPGVLREKWLMTESEKIALTGILARLRPRGAIEIGVYCGASLSLAAQFSGHIIGIDNDAAVTTRFVPPANAEIMIGDSRETIPRAIDRLKELGLPLQYALVDGDHSVEGVQRDIDLLLRYRPSAPMVIVAHDSGNQDCRSGILAAGWQANPHVHSVQCDFVPGQLIEHSIQGNRGEVWGGLALAYLDPQPRSDPLQISEGARTMIRGLQFLAQDLSVLPGTPAQDRPD